MRKAAIIGVTWDGKSELLCGMTKYSEARGQVPPLLINSKFAEVYLVEPGKRYRLVPTAPETKTKSKSKE